VDGDDQGRGRWQIVYSPRRVRRYRGRRVPRTMMWSRSCWRLLR